MTVADQCEDPAFLRRELIDQSAVAVGHALHREPDGGLVEELRSVGDRSDRRDEVVALHLLQDIASRAGHRGVDECAVIGVGGEDQARDARALGSDLPTDLDAGAVVETHVENGDVGLGPGDHVHGLAGRRCFPDDGDVVLGVEEVGDTPSDDLVIVEEEDPDRGGAGVGVLRRLGPIVRHRPSIHDRWRRGDPCGVCRADGGRVLADRWREREARAVTEGPPDDDAGKPGFRVTNDFWQAVLSTAVDPIIVIDALGTIVTANDATFDMFGFATDDLIGRNVAELMPEPHRSDHDRYIADYLRTGEAKIIGVGREVEAQRADGTRFPIQLAVSEVKTVDGAFFTGIIRDLTEWKASQRLLAEANERLEERVAERTESLTESLAELARSNRDLERFAYVASHDLRAPLRNVRQGLELLDAHLADRGGAGLDGEADELRGLVIDAVDRMEHLIGGLLTYARVQRTGKPPDTEVDLDLVVADVVGQLDAGDVVISTDPLPTVVGDASQLQQLLFNLIENAVRYRAHDREPRVGVVDRSTADEWRIEVVDNGIGIEPDDQERIFELFRRAHQGYDGVGLGLTICQRIVERHGGTILVDSSPDAGAKFTVVLPRSSPGGSPAIEAGS